MPRTAIRRREPPHGIQLELADNQHVAAYNAYYASLSLLREEFHRTGRYDDANVKLDEIVKLLVMHIHEARRATTGQVDRFTTDYLEKMARDRFGDSSCVARTLRLLSEEILNDPVYHNPDGSSIFGGRPVLNIQPTDDEFARQVVQAVRSLFLPVTMSGVQLIEQFDVLNESFGHFVRDSFHQTKEDAQYMTPPEVVGAMTDMVFSDLETDGAEVERILQSSQQAPYVVLDPTCGVGSFLVQALRRMLRLARASMPDNQSLASLTGRIRDHCIYGQDKVDRMVRLAKVNLLLFGGSAASVWQGNSIRGESGLDSLQGKVDLILTNPPFGAEYDLQDLLYTSPRDRYPMLCELRGAGRLPRRLNSELILLDRCLALMRPGGRLLIVLPDNVISARGSEATIREWLGRNAELKAVVELPGGAFAQAGTRTKTCFVYLRKKSSSLPGSVGNRRTYVAVCEDLGYEVIERTGAPVKVHRGENQLPAINTVYRDTSAHADAEGSPYLVVGQQPSAVWVRRDAFINGRWTPSFYHTRRIGAVNQLEKLRSAEFELRALASIARLCSRERRSEPPAPGTRIISVLHVSTEGIINLKEVSGYDPKTGGLNCRPGEVLFSKINPRIPRVCVVPDASFPLACSTEFEILQPGEGLGPYLLAAILVSPSVQDQVRHLTSGTSSSHNRIKDSELAGILVPVPRLDSPLWLAFLEIGEALRHATETRYAADAELLARTSELSSMIAPLSRPGSAA